MQPYTLPGTGGTLSGHYTAGSPMLVLIHGFPEQSALWAAMASAIEEAGVGILAPDLPGVGGTTGSPALLDAFAQSVLEAMDRHSVEKAVVAGHSMGGYTALALAEAAPHRVQGLMLVHSTPAADNAEKKETRRRAIAAMEAGRATDFLKTAIPPMFSAQTKRERPDLVEDFLTRAKRQPAESLIRFYEAIAARPDRSAVLKAAAFPIAAILGADDGVIPVEVGKEALAVAGVTNVSVYAGSGHLSMLEEPQKLAADLIRFVRSVIAA